MGAEVGAEVEVEAAVGAVAEAEARSVVEATVLVEAAALVEVLLLLFPDSGGLLFSCTIQPPASTLYYLANTQSCA